MLRITQNGQKIWDVLTNAKKRGIKYVVLRGGTSAAKTYEVLSWLFTKATFSKVPFSADITAENIPVLERGVLRDINEHGIGESVGYNFENYNMQRREFKFPHNGVKIRLPIFETEQQGRGGRRNILFVNEANGITWEIFCQLDIRTNDLVIIDFNPSSHFWVDNLTDRADCIELVLDYTGNDALSPEAVAKIEEHKPRDGEEPSNWWRVYGKGEYGIHEGLIIKNWKSEEFDPQAFDNYRNGVDWGFSTDPFAFTRVALDITRRKLWVCDEWFRTNVSNREAAEVLLARCDGEIVYCDSAEPKSIDELKQYGVRAISAYKAPGSVENGLRWLQDFDIIVHPSCKNVIKELSTYSYKKDRINGGYLPVPEDKNNHGIDSIRYAISNDIGQVSPKLYIL